MHNSGAEYARLRLISLSKQRLNMARNANWAELEALNNTWYNYLVEAQETFGSELDLVAEQLVNDNEELIKILAEEQNKVTQNFRNLENKLTKVREYFK